jgi:HK97 family phage portal protein
VASIIERVRSLLPTQRKSAVQVTPDGWIDTSWDWSWWQQGRQPRWVGALPIVEACLAAYSQTAAQCPGGHFRRNSAGGWDRITTSALSRVLAKPNSYQTRSDFILNGVRSLLTHGNLYAYATRNDRYEVDELHLLDPRLARAVRSLEVPGFYAYALNKYEIPNGPLVDVDQIVQPRDMLHIRLHTPRDPLVGESPLSAAANATKLNSTIGGSLSRFYENMSRPSGVLSTEEKLTKEQVLRLREVWEQQSKSLATGGVPILSWGMKWQPLSMTAQDAQIIDAYKMSLRDICRVFRVPMMLVGEADQAATFNNTETLMRFWLASGLGFLIDHLEVAIGDFFGLPANETVEFDTEVLLRSDLLARMDGLTKAVQGGIYSPNEARAKEGLPAVEDGDEPRVQQQVVPLSYYREERAAKQQAAETAAAATAAAAAAADEPAPVPDDSAAADKAADTLRHALKTYRAANHG